MGNNKVSSVKGFKMNPTKLSQVVEDLKKDLDVYYQDAVATARADEETETLPQDPSQNE